jgi:hypothetical protein
MVTAEYGYSRIRVIRTANGQMTGPSVDAAIPRGFDTEIIMVSSPEIMVMKITVKTHLAVAWRFRGTGRTLSYGSSADHVRDDLMKLLIRTPVARSARLGPDNRNEFMPTATSRRFRGAAET